MVQTIVFAAMAPVAVVASLAMPAGIGGGLLYVALLTCMGVTADTRQAAAMAQPLIMGATLAAIVYNVVWQRRHPEKRLMEPQIALAAIPPCLAGSLAGTLLNKALPSFTIHVTPVLVLLYAIRAALRKALAMWEREKAAAGQGTVQREQSSGEIKDMPTDTSETSDLSNADFMRRARQTGTPHSARSVLSFISGKVACDIETGIDACKQAEPADSSPKASMAVEPTADMKAECECPDVTLSNCRAWLALLVVWSVLVVSLVLRGGKGFSITGIQECSPEYWGITAANLVFLAAISLFVRRSEVQSMSCFGIGALSSTVGVCCGIVLNPMLLGAGVEPAVATATVTVMVTMVSSSATVNLALAGAIPVVPTLLLASGAFFGSLFGKSVIGWLVKRTGHDSLLVFLMVVVLSIAAAAVACEGLVATLHDFSHGPNPIKTFHNPCM